MDPKITQEILDDLIPSLENLETRSGAILEFLKDEGIASDEKLAPYFEKAASASNVRWLGVRVRIERLLSAAEKESANKKVDPNTETTDSRSSKGQAEKKTETGNRKTEPAEKKSAESIAKPETEFHHESNTTESQFDEKRARNKESKSKEISSQSLRGQEAKAANPPFSNPENASLPKAGNNEPAPAGNPSNQKVA